MDVRLQPFDRPCARPLADGDGDGDGDGIWIVEAPLRFFGVPFGARMTVLRLDSGALFLHSPIAIDDALARALEELGPISELVSPNKLHHLYLSAAAARFPRARVWLPPGLAKKRSGLSFHAELGDQPPDDWARELDQLVLRGSHWMEEVVFLHRATRTLIVADTCEYFGAQSPPLTRWVARLGRMYERPRMPPDWQYSFKDRATTRKSFERLLSWDFERVILAHGRLIERDAKAVFERAYAWALRA